jgi:hypothetical protein
VRRGIQLFFADPEVLNAIKWSEHLDPLFINNYEMDPSLSWQYFGSSTGFLRRYPGELNDALKE